MSIRKSPLSSNLNLLRWNDRAARRRPKIFRPKLPHFLSFKYIENVIQTKQMISSLLLNHFYRVRMRKKATNRCTRCTVTRYGPRTSFASAGGCEEITKYSLLLSRIVAKLFPLPRTSTRLGDKNSRHTEFTFDPEFFKASRRASEFGQRPNRGESE